MRVNVFSCASAKAERSLSSLSCVWMYVDQNLGTPPAKISWICTKMLHHFCMTPNLPMTKKTPLAKLSRVHSHATPPLLKAIFSTTDLT